VTFAVVRTGSSALWYLSRGTGVVVLLLLTASVVLGILLSVGWRSPQWPRLVTNNLHRNVSLLVMAFLALHIVTAVTDPFAGIAWVGVVVPMATNYRPVWLGFGALAFDLLMAIVLTSLVRKQIGLRLWRKIHWATYAAWPLALVHGMGTGTDVSTRWMLAVDAACLLVVLAAVWWRLAAVARPGPGGAVSRVPAWAVITSVVLPAMICSWLVLGPLRPGWARRAGTPPRLLAAARGLSPAGSAGPLNGAGTAPGSPLSPGLPAAPVGAWPAGGFTAQMSGTLSQTAPDAQGNTTVIISSQLRGTVSGALLIVLHGQALAGQGVQMSSSQVTAGPTAHPDQYQGRVSGLAGTRIDMTVSDQAGHSLAATAVVRIDTNGTTVTGDVRAQPAASGSSGSLPGADAG
jgi:hypothetical protein